MTVSAADDTLVYVDNGLAGDTWTIENFDASGVDQINLGAAAVVGTPEVNNQGNLVIELNTGDELQLVGVSTFDLDWIVV